MKKWWKNMQNKDEIMKKNICDVCGTETGSVTNKIGCPVCDDIYFEKIKESYSQNLQRFNIASKDLFNLFFNLSDESVQYSHEIISQYLEMEKNLRIYNPPLYYFLTSYQFFRNRFLGNAIQSVDMLYSNFMDIWKSNHSIVSKNTISMLENMNLLCKVYDKTVGVKEKPSISEEDKKMIKTINNVNRIYDEYQKEEETSKSNISRSTAKAFGK
ncbi:MAG TPA: hypothetical protein VFW99_00345 [Candidatus Nitrosotalea sp.]|nr:hypothetical protein [Candidatus Nitrosotalea sp.]